MKLNVNLKLVLVMLPAFILAACGGGGGGGSSDTGSGGGTTGGGVGKEVRNFIPPKCPLRSDIGGAWQMPVNATNAECLRGTYSGALAHDGRSCSIDFMGAAGVKFTVAGNSAVYTPPKDHIPEFRYVNHKVTHQPSGGANQLMRAYYIYESRSGKDIAAGVVISFVLSNGTSDQHRIKIEQSAGITRGMNTHIQPDCIIDKVIFQ